MNTRPTLHQLIDSADGSYKALLAAEIVQKTGRQHGPIDGKCEVCGNAADSFTLADWKSWHCFACVVVGQHDDHHDGIYVDCSKCVAEWQELAS